MIWALALLVGGGLNSCSLHHGNVYVHCTDDGNDLVQLLKDEGFRIKTYGSATDALEAAGNGAAVLLLGSRYPDTPQTLSQEQVELISRKSLKVFAEFASLSQETPELREINLERIVVTEPFGGLASMELLTLNRAVFLEAEAEDPVMVIARVAGFDKAVYGLEDTPSRPLVYRAGENLWVGTSKLSDFSRLRLMPEKNWKLFWEEMMTRLTGKEVSFSSWPSAIKPAYSRCEALPDSARFHAVRKGMEWFFNGHFLVHPSWKEDWQMRYQGDGLMPVGPELPADAPDGDGSLGVLEGHCSAIYKDGRQAYRYWLRDDVQGESSMAFAIAGDLLGEERYKAISERLGDYSFREFRDGPRNDPGSPSFGLLSWAYTHKWVYYGDDNARSILGSILAGKVLGTSKWDKQIKEAIDANFNTTGRNGFRGPRLHEADIQANGLAYYQNRDIVNPHPHFESWLWACYLWEYARSGDRKYLDLAEKGISLTMAAYPDAWNWTNGIQQERARMVLPLAWLYRVRPTEEHKGWLDSITADLAANQVECGAIREELGDPARGHYGSQKSNAEYGTGEAPLIFENGDPVADMLYTCNFAVFGLHEAACATGDPKIREMAESLADFLIRIQARSDTYKNVDGAWFRAFNYRNWDYWASNADAGWGAQSTLTGWIQSWIVTTLALMEKETSYWELTMLRRAP